MYNYSMIECTICHNSFRTITASHLKTHNITTREYNGQFKSSVIVVRLKCSQCGTIFNRYPSQIGKFCSKQCVNKSRRLRDPCEICGKEVSFAGGKTCSRQCSRRFKSNPNLGYRKYTKNDLLRACALRNYKLLTHEYTGVEQKIKVQCSCGHTWRVLAGSIIGQRSGCPCCSKYITQEKCRYILEKLTGESWFITRDIISPLELDMYCEKYNTAFEYHGEQHFREIKTFFHKHRSLDDQVKRDTDKREKCLIEGVCLFEIPYWEAQKDDVLLKYITDRLIQSNIPIKCSHFELSEFYNKYGHCRVQLSRLQNIAESKGGKCLSGYYINSSTKLCFVCASGHKWKSSPSSIISGRWCLKCGHVQTGQKISELRRTASFVCDNLKRIVNSRSGKILTPSHQISHRKAVVEFQCSLKHKFKTKAGIVLDGSWCMACRNLQQGDRQRKYSIENMRKYAALLGGKCLSNEYISSHKKLTWQCRQEHVWDAVPGSILYRNTWCPRCAQSTNDKKWRRELNLKEEILCKA